MAANASAGVGNTGPLPVATAVYETAYLTVTAIAGLAASAPCSTGMENTGGIQALD